MAALTAGVALFCCAANATADQPQNKQSDRPRVLLETSMGKITLELRPDKAPATVANFLKYVDSGFYDGLIFHRVVDDFVIQGGGYDRDMNPRRKNLRSPIKNESENGLPNQRGTVAMARGRSPDSATSQFFINVTDNPELDYNEHRGSGYAVFGRVVNGMDVVDRIRYVPCEVHARDPAKGKEGPVNPQKPVIIIKAQRLKTKS